MKINPVHALLEVLRQQARNQISGSSKAKPGTVQDALKQVRAQVLDEATVKPGSTIEQILAESKDTKFRLEMLEKLVGDNFDVRGVSSGSTASGKGSISLDKLLSANLASSAATDAINQTAAQSHGRAWFSQTGLWNNAEAEFLKYDVIEPGMKLPENPIGIAQKFTPTVDDIESALFNEGADPTAFAKVFMAHGDVPFDVPQQRFAPRLVPIVFGVLMLLVVAYLIL